MLPNALQPSATDHVPVLAEEVRDLLGVQPGDTVVDATFGAGATPSCSPQTSRRREAHRDRPRPVCADLLRALPAPHRIQSRFLRGEFATVLDQLARTGSRRRDPARPRRLQHAARPARARVLATPSTRRSTCGWIRPRRLTRRRLVNELDERELATIFRRYGEERFARPIARAIVRAPTARAVRAHGRARGRDQGGDPRPGALRRRPSRQAGLPGAPHRRQRRARPARGGAPGGARDAPAAAAGSR